MKSNRLQYIDYVKGLTILVLLFSHSYGGEGKLQTWIFSWHMPIFFVICGILVHLKIERKGSISLKNHSISRLYNLFQPYFLFGLILIAFFAILSFATTHNTNAGPLFFKLFTMQGIESMWFLPTYFFAEILFLTLLHYSNQIVPVVLATIIILLSSLLDIPQNYWFHCLVGRILRGYVFIVIGYYCAKYQVIEKLNPIISLLILIAAGYLSQLNGFTSLHSTQASHAPLYFLDATLTSITILSLFFFLEQKLRFRSRVLRYLGTSTIIVVCTNNLLIEILRLVDYKLMGNHLLNMGLIGSFVFFVLLTLLEIPFVHIFKGKFKRP